VGRDSRRRVHHRRALCFNLYIGNPDKRGPGVLISVLATATLIIGSIVGAILKLV
jgi:hypothetical protein